MRAFTNDLDLIASVIALAQDPGYVLIGPTERVWRCRIHGGPDIEPAPTYEDAAVHQLIDRKLLCIGGTKHMRHGRHEGRARLIVVPNTTAAMAWRWSTYKSAR